jgi:integrase
VLTDGKSDKARRWIPLTTEAVAAIKRWRAIQATERLKSGPFWEDSGYLFTSERGTLMDPGNVAKQFRKIAKKAGGTASPHRLRHTLATDLLANGVSLREVQELLGHASSMTTAAMCQTVTPAHKRATMDRLTEIRRRAPVTVGTRWDGPPRSVRLRVRGGGPPPRPDGSRPPYRLAGPRLLRPSPPPSSHAAAPAGRRIGAGSGAA